MSEKHVATSTILISAKPERVWSVITDPAATKEFMFGTEVVTDWVVGGPIRWLGIWEGKHYEDHGKILEFEPCRTLVTTHFSPLTGQDDVAENYHTLTWALEEVADSTRLTLAQDNNDSPEAATHSKQMWDGLVQSVKEISERD
jgi:uncharacterized protein YndB with AHSA1/START domain